MSKIVELYVKELTREGSTMTIVIFSVKGGEGCEDIQTRRQVQHLRGESQRGAAAG